MTLVLIHLLTKVLLNVYAFVFTCNSSTACGGSFEWALTCDKITCALVVCSPSDEAEDYYYSIIHILIAHFCFFVRSTNYTFMYVLGIGRVM